MANLTGNLKSLVDVKGDKRDQLPPQKVVTATKPRTLSPKAGAKPLRSSKEPHVSTRLLLPESLKQDLDRFFIDKKLRGKNEFLIAAVREYLERQKKKG